MTDHVQSYVSSERSSRVPAPRFVPSALTQVLSFGRPPPSARQGPSRHKDSPSVVLLDPTGQRVVTDADLYGVIDLASKPRSFVPMTSAPIFDDVVLEREGIWATPRLLPWSGGAPRRDERFHKDPDAAPLVSDRDGETTIAVVLVRKTEESDGGAYIEAVRGGRHVMRTFSDPIDGAISRTRGVALVVNRQAKLIVHEPPFTTPSDATWPVRFESKLGVVSRHGTGLAYDLSFVDEGVAVVSAGTSDGFSTRERHRRDDPGWTSVVTVFDDRTGKEVHRIALPWSVAMPVIAAGPGRFIVAGSKLVAFERGKEAWHLDGGLYRATAFEDGSLAVTRNDELLVLDRDGKELARLRTPDGERFTTPPAIAGDRSIWVATHRDLYVAR
jgi:hypothetical protein